MTTIQELFQQAQLAEAAYADFSDPNVSIIAALQNTNNGGSFTEAQATEFVKHWKVVNQVPDLASGFSATVFESLDDPGHYSLAIRGSLQWADFLEDAGIFATDGVAVSQVVDLYNYWQYLTHTGTYKAATLETQQDATDFLSALYAGNDAEVPATLLELFGGVDVVTSYDVARDVLVSNDYIVERGIVYKLGSGDSTNVLAGSDLAEGVGKLPADAVVDVDGHSLGGHLAMAFSRLFPGSTSEVTAVNGLGFKIGDANVDNLFAGLSGLSGATDGGFNASSIENIYGINGPEFASMNNTVLQQPGGWDGIFIESANLDTYGGHLASQMTDSLAIYNLFATIDPSLNMDTITGILNASEILSGETTAVLMRKVA